MDTLTDKEIIEKIKTTKDACMELRIPVQKIALNNTVSDIANSVNAFYQLCIITRALNQNWIPDINDWRQPKWYNWFYIDSSGAFSGLSSSSAYYSPAVTSAAIGARLCFKSKELAIYAREQFLSLHEQYLLIK
ncbi:MAG: hypothetical protein WCR20_01330 [Verrucomicrobiota bacterium]